MNVGLYKLLKKVCINKRQMQLVGYLEKMSLERDIKSITWKAPESKRNRGMPKETWKDALKEENKNYIIGEIRNKRNAQTSWPIGQPQIHSTSLQKIITQEDEKNFFYYLKLGLNEENEFPDHKKILKPFVMYGFLAGGFLKW